MCIRDSDETTPIRAPLNGKVVILHNNDFKYDYGPTVILEHKISTYKFYTLYGHLSKKCLKKLKVGQSINKGDWIGEIGGYNVNGKFADKKAYDKLELCCKKPEDN